MKRFSAAFWLVVVLELGIAGCGSRPSLGKVSGTVCFKGQPIQHGTIIFEVTGARPATGRIVDGQICEVTTFAPSDGVPVGTAKIAVFAAESPAEQPKPEAAAATPGKQTRFTSNYMGMNSRSLIPPRYNHPDSSGLRWDVKKGVNVLAIELTEREVNRPSAPNPRPAKP